DVHFVRRLDLVPPELGQVERVAGLELDDQGAIADRVKAGVPRVPRRARSGEAHRLTGHRVIDRPYIEIGDRFGRIERETPPAGDDAGEVVECVEVAGDP